MKLRVFRRRKDDLFYYQFISEIDNKVILRNKIGFTQKIERDKHLEAFLRSAKDSNNRIELRNDDGSFQFQIKSGDDNIAKSKYFLNEKLFDTYYQEFINDIDAISENFYSKNAFNQHSQKSEQILYPKKEASTIKNDLNLSNQENSNKESWSTPSLSPKKSPSPIINNDNDLNMNEKTEDSNRKKEEARKTKLELEERARKRKLEREKKEREKEAAIQIARQRTYDDNGGCLKWVWWLFGLGLLLLLAWQFKGCFGEGGKIDKDDSVAIETVDDKKSNQNTKEETDTKLTSSEETSPEEIEDDSETTSSSNSQTEKTKANTTKANTTSSSDASGCNCNKEVEIFKIPDTEAVAIDDLDSKPQFGNVHGLSPSDFIEELKHYGLTSKWDRKYLNYLFKSMGFNNGFRGISKDNISNTILEKGSKGILGSGKSNGFEYSQLNLDGKDLEAFAISSEDGCQIYFMKTGGNFFFQCDQ